MNTVKTPASDGGVSPAEAAKHLTQAQRTRLQDHSADERQRQAAARRALRLALARLDDLSQADRATLAAPLAAALAVVERAGVEMAPKEVAFEIGVHESTVRGWCIAGRLGHRVGGRWRIGLTELRALLAGERP